jgi:hypothetical protein
MSLAPRTSTAPDVANSAKRAANEAVDNPWVVRFLRFGNIARGVVYVVVGVLALRLSLGIRDVAMSQSGAFAVIGRQPFGHALLVAVAVGLASYALWDVIRAVADPIHEARWRGGLAKRLGFAAGALAYVALTFIVFRFVIGPRPSTATSYDPIAWVLEKPLGAWLLAIVGLGWTAIVALQVASTWRDFFERNLDIGHRSRVEQRWAKGLGRIGIVTRGILFAMIGMLLVASALHVNPHHLTGIDGALLELARQPFGRTLLAAAGLGLVAFGAFSIMCARWMRVGTPSDSQTIQPSSA